MGGEDHNAIVVNGIGKSKKKSIQETLGSHEGREGGFQGLKESCIYLSDINWPSETFARG